MIQYYLKDGSTVPFGAMVSIDQWDADDSTDSCRRCYVKWNIFCVRRHHCRNCGHLVCHTCSNHYIVIRESTKPVRICQSCISLMCALLLEDGHYALFNAQPKPPTVKPTLDQLKPVSGTSTMKNDKNDHNHIEAKLNYSSLADVARFHLHKLSSIRIAPATTEESIIPVPVDDVHTNTTGILLNPSTVHNMNGGTITTACAPTATTTTTSLSVVVPAIYDVEQRQVASSPRARSPLVFLPPTPPKLQNENTLNINTSTSSTPTTSSSSYHAWEGEEEELTPQAKELQDKMDNLSDTDIEKIFIKIKGQIVNKNAIWDMNSEPERILLEILSNKDIYFDKNGNLIV